MNDLLERLSNLIRQEVAGLRDDNREDMQNMREDLGSRIDAVGDRVREQNSRIAKGEARDTEIERRLNIIEAGHRFVVSGNMPRPENPPESDFAGRDPVTGRDLKVLAWGASAAVTTATFLWGVLKWIGQVRP